MVSQVSKLCDWLRSSVIDRTFQNLVIENHYRINQVVFMQHCTSLFLNLANVSIGRNTRMLNGGHCVSVSRTS